MRPDRESHASREVPLSRCSIEIDAPDIVVLDQERVEVIHSNRASDDLRVRAAIAFARLDHIPERNATLY